MCIELGEAARPVDWKNNPAVWQLLLLQLFIAGGRFSEFRFSAGLLSNCEHSGKCADNSVYEKIHLPPC